MVTPTAAGAGLGRVPFRAVATSWTAVASLAETGEMMTGAEGGSATFTTFQYREAACFALKPAARAIEVWSQLQQLPKCMIHDSDGGKALLVRGRFSAIV